MNIKFHNITATFLIVLALITPHAMEDTEGESFNTKRVIIERSIIIRSFKSFQHDGRFILQ
jgi:hypothetical protein